VTNSAVVNFRTRTGQARRARTRANILSTAFALFDERGVDQVTVEDVRESAGLARGSFYNYFLTYEHMLKELAAQIGRSYAFGGRRQRPHAQTCGTDTARCC